MPYINNLSVTRLFSTGRFEHTKFSISLTPQSGDSPGAILREIESIVEDLNPTCPVDDYDLNQAKEFMALPEEERTIRDAPNQYGMKTPLAEEIIAKATAWQSRRESAYQRLDILGASVEEQRKEADQAENAGGDAPRAIEPK